MHRLTFVSLALVLASASACGGKAKDPDTAADKVDTGDKGKTDEGGGKGADGEGKGASGGETAEAPKDECAGFDVNNLEEILLKSACEESGVKPDTISPVDMKGKLAVTVSASPTKTTPGGKADLLVTFANKTKEPITLHFRIDPMPRLEVETYNAKGKRVDMPAGNPPPPPKGATQPPPSEAKSAKLTLAAAGSARMRVGWEAVKMKWAPDKYKGTPPERGYPRTAAGPLPKGKYSVKVLTPLVGVAEGIDHEVSGPKVEIEIEK
jgi:hypothetical protein